MSLLSVRDLGKAFRLYRHEWQRFGRWFGLPFEAEHEAWVLRHVGFDVQPGEAIGIIGRNGAGKSTLLKLIAETIFPTEGSVHSNGRIAAILELGMGFDRELTGRQNARHAASLMGFTAAQIDAALPDIEAFAEIGDYFDQPMRTYSSGMEIRVAFAVATAWRPDILIVDEALSVGDTYFQHKSLARMRSFRDAGTALLIVSHDAGAIKSLCQRALLIDHGSLVKDGSPEELYDYYNAIIAESGDITVQVNALEDGRVQTVSGTGEARVMTLSLHDSAGDRLEHVRVGQDVELRFAVRVYEPIGSLVLGYGIKDRLGQVVFGINTHATGQVITDTEPGQCYTFSVKFRADLGVGSYSVQTALVDGDTHLSCNYEWKDMALMFNVVNTDKPQFQGTVWTAPRIEIEATKS